MASIDVDGPDVFDLPPIRWGWFVALGVAVVILGMILLVRPFDAAGTLALLIGFALLFEAIEMLFDARYVPKPWLGYLLGVIYLVTAIIAIAWPGITLFALAVVVGIGLILSGIALLMLRSDMNRFGVGGLPIWGGVLSIIAGILALAWPGATILVLSVILGVRVLFSGAALIATGLTLRRLN